VLSESVRALTGEFQIPDCNAGLGGRVEREQHAYEPAVRTLPGYSIADLGI